MDYLYRGVSTNIHKNNDGRLVPQRLEVFTYAFQYSETGLKYGSGVTYGSSETNAVIRHQLNQEGFPTSGVSTTPFFERARYYALGKDTSTGYVYKIDRSLLQQHGVSEFVVSSFAKFPSVPEDHEVILVSSDFGELPSEIIIEVIAVR